MKTKDFFKRFFILSDAKVLILAFLLYFPFIFLGYGSDYDSYNVLWAGRNYLQTWDYVPSRVPGFVVYEALILLLDSIGGSLLTNLLSLGMSLVILFTFMKICKIYQIPHYHLLALALMLHPYFWVNSTCSMDYLIALGFALAGLLLALKGRVFWAGLTMGMAIGSRMTTLIVVAVFLVWLWISQPADRRKVFLTAMTALFFAVLFYIPPADFSEWNANFLKPSVSTQDYWTPLLRVGRFIYKNLFYFWNPLAVILLAWSALRVIGGHKQVVQEPYFGLLLTSIAVILGVEAFYLRLPTEPAYLLPTLPFWLIILGIAFRKKRLPLLLMIAVLFVSNFVSINIAQPDQKNYATGADYGVWVEEGHLLKDVRIRQEYLACGNQPCSYLEDPASAPPGF